MKNQAKATLLKEHDNSLVTSPKKKRLTICLTKKL
jgi:hypothetical protein